MTMIKEKPLVSVIIPTFNRANIVGETLDSVLAQTYPNIEIIVVDDGSKDNTAQALQKYAGKILYLKQENQGNSAARNYGLKQAKGKFIGFLDDDDLWLPEKVQKEVEFLEGHPDHGFVYSGTYYIDKEGHITGQRVRFADDENTTFERLYQVNMIISPSVALFHRECLDRVGHFDVKLYQSSDYDLFLRIAKLYKFAYIDQILSKYRVHQGNLSKNLDRRLLSHIQILKKEEVSGGKTWLERRIRLSDDYYQIATHFYQDNNFLKAARYYFGALRIYPFIGFYHWPKEVKQLKFSFIYRILKVYLLVIYCFCKGVFLLPSGSLYRKYL